MDNLRPKGANHGTQGRQGPQIGDRRDLSHQRVDRENFEVGDRHRLVVEKIPGSPREGD